jgi:flagellar biosynthesis/type III secretory pathway M-ring protein FliF/YscJ
MWQVFVAIVVAIVLFVIAAIIVRARKASKPLPEESLVNDSSSATQEEPASYESTSSYDDSDECRCSAPGGSCCWK